MVALNAFLTSYDPNDLPGSSVDPLGFDRAYNLLADKLLPGLTNVASKPRYFSLLCAGVVLADEAGLPSATRETPREVLRHRRGMVERLERYWALANVLASDADPALDFRGIRGIRYVQARVRRLRDAGDTSVDAEYRLLAHQARYGALGIYGRVAEGLKFLARDTFELSPGLGRLLGEAFLDETRMSAALRKAVVEGTAASLRTLADWGARGHLMAPVGRREGELLEDALRHDPVRSRMADLLWQHPAAGGEPELGRFRRLYLALCQRDEDADLREALRTVLAFERCYTLALLGLVRVLWMVDHATTPTSLSSFEGDSTFAEILREMPLAVSELARAVEGGETAAFRRDLDRGRDAWSFGGELAAARTTSAVIETILRRHTDVQHGKLDRGKRKMPWLEVDRGVVRATMSQALQLPREPQTTDDVLPHEYRSRSADALLQAAGSTLAAVG